MQADRGWDMTTEQRRALYRWHGLLDAGFSLDEIARLAFLRWRLAGATAVATKADAAARA